MAATQQSQAIQDANTVISLGAQLLSLYNAIVAANQAWQDHTALTVLQAMGTVAQNGDGTLGTADGTPNVTHPLNAATYPTLQRAVSSTDIANVLTQLNNIVSYVNGGALSATPGVRTVLNKVSGG